MEAKIILIEDVFFFDAGDGTPAQEVKVWLEKSKANDKHPDGKPWIVLPNGNPTNRKYYSKDLFDATNVNGEVVVEVKTAAPRVLGATGVKQEVIKYLTPEEAEEYTLMVEAATEAYKEAKANSKKKKPEEMDAEELELYITALRNGETYTPGQGPKSFLEMFDEDQYARYNELLAAAATAKANAPKAARRKLTEEEKAARAEKRAQAELSKAEALLAALKASL